MTTSLHAYQHRQSEKKWIDLWEEKGYAYSSPKKKKVPYVMILPPPNVTGVLHMGHILNGTVQDVLIRKARMEGKEACWVPGTDHASIATEAKVVARLQARGMTKQELGREKFLEEAWAWKEEHEKIILRQLKRLGLSCDWKRLAFTMDEVRSKSVRHTFVRLYEEGYIYRGTRMIHWDPKGQTALADEEVIYKEVKGKLYHIAYPMLGSKERLIIATTRPETLLGDTAIAVHPEDPRYQALHGKKAIIPLIEREIPILADPYVDQEFGTGALKVTPAHDANDYELGKKYDLDSINILDADGKLNEAAGGYAGLDRFEARKRIVEELEKSGALIKVTSHVHKVGFSERTDAVVEPRLSTQWFVRMKELAQPATAAVKKGEVRFYPDRYVTTYLTWMENIRDWCISRQLWWGHRIPAYFLSDGSYVVAETSEEALRKASVQHPKKNLTMADLKQDEDVLDTWFSSWLWPLSVFNGILQPKNEEICYYYPTEGLVTAPEIIFFWVARMVVAGHYFKKEFPFKTVYFTGIVRDPQRRKMSKSLGNSPEPMELMEQYSVDGVRSGILLSSPAGNDLLFDEKLCRQGYQFVHKIYNAYRLIAQWQEEDSPPTSIQERAMAWFQARYDAVVSAAEKHFENFRISDALMSMYKLVWSDFCGHYLEMIKPRGSKAVSGEVYGATALFFRNLMKLLHPFMPFITEEIWQRLGKEAGYESIMIAPWPQSSSFNKNILSQGEKAFSLLKKIRDQRKKTAWGKENLPTLFWKGEESEWLSLFQDYLLEKGMLKEIVHNPKGKIGAGAFVLGGHTFWWEGLPQEKKEGVLQKQEEELAYQKRFLAAVCKKLENPAFLANAPQEVLAREKKKKEDAQKRIQALESVIKRETFLD